jgi:hypothetical protein
MAERYIPEHRRTQFKAKGTFKPEELRRRREEQQVEIRKAKREENLAKRRGITGGDGLSLRGAALGAAPESDDDTAPTESQVRENKLLYRMIFPFPYKDSRVTAGSSGPLIFAVLPISAGSAGRSRTFDVAWHSILPVACDTWQLQYLETSCIQERLLTWYSFTAQ